MAQFDYDPGEGFSINRDQWDGYTADRDHLLNFIKEQRPFNPIVLSGDWHSSWVNDLKEDFNNPDSKTLATEFVGTSISSGCGWRDDVEAALTANPHVKFFNGDYRGYVRCHVTPKAWTSEYRIVSATGDPDAELSTLTSFTVQEGIPGAIRNGGVDVFNVTAKTMLAGKSNPVSVSLSNGTDRTMKVQVQVRVPKGWKSDKVSVKLEPNEMATIEVLVTPPAHIPNTAKLSIEVKAGNIQVYGTSREFYVVSTLSGNELLYALDGGGEKNPVFPTYTRLSPQDMWDASIGFGWVGQAQPLEIVIK